MEKLQSAVQKLIKDARKAGAVTLSQINDVLPDDASSPEHIEFVMAQVEEAGIEIVEEGQAGKGRRATGTAAPAGAKKSEDDPFSALGPADDDDTPGAEGALAERDFEESVEVDAVRASMSEITDSRWRLGKGRLPKE